MTLEFYCVCKNKIRVRDEYERSPVRCPKCGEMVKAPAKGEVQKGPPQVFDQYGLNDEGGVPQRREYKVLTQSDMFSGKVDPVRLQHILNAHAKKGWILRAVVAAETGTGGLLGGAVAVHRGEMVVILERDV